MATEQVLVIGHLTSGQTYIYQGTSGTYNDKQLVTYSQFNLNTVVSSYQVEYRILFTDYLYYAMNVNPLYHGHLFLLRNGLSGLNQITQEIHQLSENSDYLSNDHGSRIYYARIENDIYTPIAYYNNLQTFGFFPNTGFNDGNWVYDNFDTYGNLYYNHISSLFLPVIHTVQGESVNYIGSVTYGGSTSAISSNTKIYLGVASYPANHDPVDAYLYNETSQIYTHPAFIELQLDTTQSGGISKNHYNIGEQSVSIVNNGEQVLSNGIKKLRRDVIISNPCFTQTK